MWIYSFAAQYEQIHDRIAYCKATWGDAMQQVAIQK